MPSSSNHPDQSPPEFQSYIKPEEKIAEFTVRALVVGILLAIVFGVANAYLGLKIGMTISASIPAAVISMAVLRGILRRGTILENNIAQTIGSSGESLAAGIVFTVPALIFLGVSPKILEIFVLSALGGCMGMLFMIPLRRYLIVKEHKNLPYPEGTACAKILVAGDSGGSKAKTVFIGAMIGGIYKFLMSGLGLWKESGSVTLKLSKKPLVQGVASIDATPVLLGVGYIIGPRIAALMFAGAVLGWWVLIPLIQLIGSNLSQPIPPASDIISHLTPIEIWHFYIRYIGAGAVVVGGTISLLKAMPVIFQSFRTALAGISKSYNNTLPPKGASLANRPAEAGRVSSQRAEGGSKVRTQFDIPMKYVMLIAGLVILGICLYLSLYRPSIDGSPLSISIWAGLGGALLIMVFGFFFITVSARIVGIVGSSSNPVSGMTLTTLIATALFFVAMGWTGQGGMVLAMAVSAIVCIAACMAGDNSQDLKTGYLVGATPYKQQLANLIGVLAPALAIAWVLLLLNKTYGFGPGTELQAPQATLLSMVLKGVMLGKLPWVLLIVGIFIGLMVELLGISCLPFAIGLYLPFKLSAPIMIGGFIAWLVSVLSRPEERTERNEKGILFGSGLVAGDALIGVLVALLATIPISEKLIEGKLASVSLAEKIIHIGDKMAIPVNPELLTTVMFAGLTIFFIAIIMRHRSKGKV